MNQRNPEATLVKFCYMPAVRAALALNQGNAKEAIEILSATSSYDLWKQPQMIAVYLGGMAYLAAHQRSQAAAEHGPEYAQNSKRS